MLVTSPQEVSARCRFAALGTADPVCTLTPDVTHEFACDDGAPSRARSLLRSAACRHHQVDLDSAALVLSELVTNAVVHAGPPLLLSVHCDATTTRIGVHDGSPQVSDSDPPALLTRAEMSAAVTCGRPDSASSTSRRGCVTRMPRSRNQPDGDPDGDPNCIVCTL